MTVFVGKAVDLVFNRRTISRTNTFDATVKHGRTIETFLQQFVHLRRSIGHIATALMLQRSGKGRIREFFGLFVSGLFRHFSIIQGTSINSWWGSCFHASGIKTKLNKVFGDSGSGTFACAATAKLFFSDMY